MAAARSASPSASRSRGKSPAKKAQPSSPGRKAAASSNESKKKDDYAEGTNWVAGGIEDNAMLFAVIVLPTAAVLLA